MEVLASMAALAQPSAPARHSATLLHWHCTAAKAAHLQRLVHPECTVSLARRVDSWVLEGFGRVVG